MTSVLIFSSLEEELKEITEHYKNIAARLDDDNWIFYTISKSAELSEVFIKALNIDVACIDVTDRMGVIVAENVRRKYQNSSIIIISDESVSPLLYIKPSICASALILRPYNNTHISILRDVLIEYRRSYVNADRSDCFILENRDGKQLIPYNKIYYFESREKKIVLGTEFEEISFYGTLDCLEEKLPSGFIRCHRSFIISADKISSVKLSCNIVNLTNGSIIPVSRTYKNTVREVLH